MKQKHVVVFIIVLGLFIIAASAHLLWAERSELGQPHQNDETSMTKEEAIEQAENYQTDEMCIMVITEAVHRETGAEYTFPTGCMPPGWEPIE